ncbi:MAG: NAD-dependent epimerase/dehydratase family protein [Nitrospinota bacterium]|nr:NAD-dependent epimerase/dehydratase family protein [Nitrospinota bacterium]
MNILVTGGCGFIGSHIVDAYIQHNHRVIVLDNLSSGKKANLNPQAIFYHMDLLDPEVKTIFQKEQIEVINHHAAQASVQRSISDPVFDANSNIIGALQLMENALSFGIKRVIFASTGGAMYGDQVTLPACESFPSKPPSPYGISKLSVENYLEFYKNTCNLSSITLRYSNVFGPRQDPHGEAGVVAIFCNRLAEHQSPVIFGDGEQTRDFISIADVVRGNLLALDSSCTGIFNLGTGKETSLNDLTKQMVRISGRQVEIKYGPAKQGEQKRSAINPTKFQEQFGWQPQKTMEEALLDTWQFFLNNQEH